MSNKWFLELIMSRYGTYYANMYINGEFVKGLPEYVKYNTLRSAIRSQTGIDIPMKMDMNFEWLKGKKYAFLDATQPRADFRVSLAEIRSGWRPRFDCRDHQEPVYIYPQANHACNLDSPCILVGTIAERTPEILMAPDPIAAQISIHVTERIKLNGTRQRMDSVLQFYDSENLYTSTLEAATEKAEEVYKKVRQIKNMPRTGEPAGPSGKDYFDVIDIKALTNQQLVAAKYLAKEFVGSQSPAHSRIRAEMNLRFEAGVKKPLSVQLESAISRTETIGTHPEIKSRDSAFVR